jgi:hypothetical protein
VGSASKASGWDIAGKTDERLIGQFQAQCERFGSGDRWIVLREGKQVFGTSDRQLAALCGDCDLLINLCGALKTDELLTRIQRRAYFDLDPGFTQAWAHQFDMHFAKHNLFFTVGLNVGEPDFPIPTQEIKWHTFPPPVALEFWPVQTDAPTRPFTPIAQWRGQVAIWQGEYYGPKREEFLRFIELPKQTSQPIELALLIHESEADDLATLSGHGWQLVNPHEVAGGLDGFRTYVQQSRGEFSVAKGGYVKSRGGWFSDRTVCYLASGRPALVQDTGIGRKLPTGHGLLTFSTMEELVAGPRSDQSRLRRVTAPRHASLRRKSSRRRWCCSRFSNAPGCCSRAFHCHGVCRKLRWRVLTANATARRCFRGRGLAGGRQTRRLSVTLPRGLNIRRWWVGYVITASPLHGSSTASIADERIGGSGQERTGQQDFGKQVLRREIEKEYVAICWGRLSDDTALLTNRLRLAEMGSVYKTRRPSVRNRVSPSLWLNGDWPIHRGKIATANGRAHQLRVHMAWLGYPIVGDKVYGPDERLYLEFIEKGVTEEMLDKLLLPRHALHAARVTLRHPPASFTVPLP